MERYQNLGFILKDVARRYVHRFEERARALALTLAQCKALLYLTRNEGISQKRLAELTDIDPMSLVRILDRMEADGWVERRADPEDRRARALHVTERAKPIVDQMLQVGADVRAEALKGLTDDERAVLFALLERVHGNLLALEPIASEPRAAPASDESAPSLAARRTGRSVR